jgi:hypothetical protein
VTQEIWLAENSVGGLPGPGQENIRSILMIFLLKEKSKGNQ